MMADEPNETPAPLSDAEIAMYRLAWERYRHDPMPMFSGDIVGQLLATLAARDAEIERLKSQVAIHETWRQDAEFRLISEHEHHMREYDFAVDDPSAFEDGRLRLRIAALKRENAAYREIVEMAAKSEGARIFEMRNRARALLATSTPPATDAAAAQEE